jgi:hypothetical protein
MIGGMRYLAPRLPAPTMGADALEGSALTVA